MKQIILAMWSCTAAH